MNDPQTFIPPHPLNTAVLFLVFNRLDVTGQVFEAIRQAKPPRLYIAADGARAEKVGEAEKVKAVRDFILSSIDWECEVKTLLRDRNLGCKYAVSKAITWFFENEDMGIILEDDCLPSQSFFWFCEELLVRYKGDLRVWNIGGYRAPCLQEKDEFSYNFSRISHIWGWASWASRWKFYDVELNQYKNNKNIIFEYEFFIENSENKSRSKLLDKVVTGEINTWDYQWNFTIRTNSGLSVRPGVNLVRNIGFGIDATHTTDSDFDIEMNLEKELQFPLKHPQLIVAYRLYDKIFNEQMSFINKLITKVRRKIIGKQK